MAHLFILDVYVSPNRKYVNLSLIYYILDFSFFMSQDDAYFHIHQNDPVFQAFIHTSSTTALFRAEDKDDLFQERSLSR